MTFAHRAARFAAVCVFLTALALATVCATGRAWAQPVGGISAVSPKPAPQPGTGPAGAAALVGGRAIAPIDAPAAVRRTIAAANRIRTKPYIWGGGHGRWWDRGYDCSGAVSFALFGGGLIPRPLTSGELEGWGAPGPGEWITVYANAGHTYAEIAGLRFDTVGHERGTGPRWHLAPTSTEGFVARHPPGY